MKSLKNFQYDINLIDNPKLTICPPKRIPHIIKNDIKKELDNMLKLDIIETITKPTEWVSPMVVVKQKNKIRICIDPSILNKNMQRRHYLLKNLDEIADKLHGPKVYFIGLYKRILADSGHTTHSQIFNVCNSMGFTVTRECHSD